MKTLLLSWLLMMASTCALLVHAAEAPGSLAAKDTLEERLMGVWVLAEATTPGTPSGIGTRQKIFTPGRWEMVQRDPQTREVIFRHGGTYRLNGDILEQKVEFASQKTQSYIGQVRKFKIKVEKDTYTQSVNDGLCHTEGFVPSHKKPNKASEPTPLPVTIPAEPGIAPGSGVAHL